MFSDEPILIAEAKRKYLELNTIQLLAIIAQRELSPHYHNMLKRPCRCAKCDTELNTPCELIEDEYLIKWKGE